MEQSNPSLGLSFINRIRKCFEVEIVQRVQRFSRGQKGFVSVVAPKTGLDYVIMHGREAVVGCDVPRTGRDNMIATQFIRPGIMGVVWPIRPRLGRKPSGIKGIICVPLILRHGRVAGILVRGSVEAADSRAVSSLRRGTGL